MFLINLRRLGWLTSCVLAIGFVHQAGYGQTAAPRGQSPATPSAGPASGEQARLTLGHDFLDAGALEYDSSKEVKMPIRNDGGRTLTINRVRAACTCFMPSIQKQTLAPGESAEVIVKVQSFQEQGEFTEKVVVASNDPAGLKTFLVRFEVLKDLSTDPEQLYVGVLQPGQEAHKTIQVVAHADIKTKISLPSSSGAWLMGKPLQSDLAKGTPATIDVVVKAPAAVGLYRNTLTVATGHPKFPSVSLPVVLSVCKSVQVAPEAVDFGRFAGQATQELTLTLGKGCSLKAATAKPDVLAIQSEPADDQGNAKVKLTVKANAPFGPFHGELLLHLNGPEQAQIAVPFAGYRESPRAF